MSGTMDGALESSVDDRMHVDTSFLDAYRRGGTEALEKVRVIDLEAELEKARPEGEHGGGQSGDQASGAAVGDELVDEATAEVTEAALEDDLAAGDLQPDADVTVDAEDESLTPSSIRLTDHQDVVQNATSGSKGGSGGGGEGEVLPQSGFHLGGVKSQPHIKALPNSVISVLREQLRSAAVRELGVSDHAAREFSERLSQGTLVTAFLLAKLDLGLDADPATTKAAELFRSQDPLLGSVVARLESLEQIERDRTAELQRLRTGVDEVRETSAVIEQLSAYSVADRSENFLRGSHNIHDAPITHKDAVFVRDRAREATKKQQRIEREREDRPIR